MSYNQLTLPDFNIKKASLGAVDITEDEKAYALYNNGDRWMVLNKKSHDEIKEMYSSYDQAYGDVFVSGLGFGILALWLSKKPEVKSVTVVEISKDVIDLFKSINEVPGNVSIINADILSFETDKKYDCLLLDHYEKQHWDWRLKNMQDICNKIKHDKFWAWSLEQAYLLKFFSIKRSEILYTKDDEGVFATKPDLSDKWQSFVRTFFPNEKCLLEIPLKTINEYIYTFNDKHHLLEIE
jgi:SAM-dependent methyltransferase